MRSSRILALISVSLAVALALASSGAAQTVTTVYSFTQQNGNPSLATLAEGRDGMLYSASGGQAGVDLGMIFKLTTAGEFGQLYTFYGANGSAAFVGVTLASDGNFYGTTFAGGRTGFGLLFRISNGKYTVLHEFAGGVDGAGPATPPIEGFDGDLYGTTYGNTATSATIYRYSLASGAFTTIYQFDETHGSSVASSLVQSANGNLYGTAYQGGANNCGTIFSVTPSGVLVWYYSFPCGPPGAANPLGSLVQADGNFYGTTQQGGAYRLGTIFELSRTGVVSVLYNFTAVPDGGSPYAGLVRATDGNLYGATSGGGRFNLGSLFQITTSGSYTQLYSFSLDSQMGFEPLVALLQHTNGLFYGTTQSGGQFSFGTVFSLDLGLGPFVRFVQPTGRVGRTVQILGQGLTGTTSVIFNGVAATNFTVASDTFMTAVVPSGATTGKVVVTTPTGTLTSNVRFRIIR